jgi:phosphate starvation-inducible PhoH-like protein
VQIQNILQNVEGVAFVYLEKKDVVRHKLVKDIINAYEEYSVKNDNGGGKPDDSKKQNL